MIRSEKPIRSNVDWPSAIAMATKQIEDALDGIEMSVYEKSSYTDQEHGYITPLGTKMDSPFGQLMAHIEQRDFELSTDGFFARYLFHAATRIANSIRDKHRPGYALETVTLELPSGCVVSERLTTAKISARLVICIDTNKSDAENIRDFVAREGEIPEEMRVEYDIVRNIQVVVKPPFHFIVRLDVLGGFRPVEVLACQ